MTRRLSLESQRILGVVNAAPHGITEHTVQWLCSRAACKAYADLPPRDTSTRLRTLQRRGLVEHRDGVWFPTPAAEPELDRCRKVPREGAATQRREDGTVGTSEAARILGINRNALIRRVQWGDIPHTVTAKGCIRICRDVLESISPEVLARQDAHRLRRK